MHLYSYCSLDLVLRGSMRYTIVLCLYMYLYMYDSLILYNCYILICLVYILICVFVASAGYLPNIEHLFGQQCIMVLWCCQVIQIMGIDRQFGIGWSYRWVLSDKENIVLLVWCGVKFYFVLMAWIDYPTHCVKVLDNRQVYDKQQLLCKQSFISNPISDYNDTYNILYSLCIMPNNYSCGIQYPIAQYPILCGNSWKLSVLLILIFL